MHPSPTTAPPCAQALYLDTGSDAAFLTYHGSDSRTPASTAVLLCPPLGWEEVCSYRPLREWAMALAAGGRPVARLSLPATGDSSGSPGDPERLAAWDEAVRAAARWLRATSGAARVVGIGLGLGGLLAYRAAAGADIDDLVLWAVPSRGRALVRQWRAFSALEASRFFEDLPQPPAREDGGLEAGGFLLSAATLAELQGIKLTDLPLPDADRRHVLLLEQDSIAVDDTLRSHLTALGVHVQVAPGDGYAQMTSHPQQATEPRTVMATVDRWLTDSERGAGLLPAARGSDGPGTAAPQAADQLNARDGAPWTEVPLRLVHGSAILSGVLTQPAAPAADICAVFLNAGAVRRIGPSRMWVETARRWAARGIPTLRLDVEGIGDSSGPTTPYAEDAALYTDTFVDQVVAVLDELQARGSGTSFILCGLCAGAYWSFHTALRDRRVRAVLLLNPRVLVWDENLAPARYVRTLLVRRPSLGHIREVVTWPLIQQVLHWLAGAPRRALRRWGGSAQATAGTARAVDRLLEQLRDADVGTMLLFSEREPLHHELAADGTLARAAQWPTLTVEHIPVNDHTLRPTWAQQRAQQALDRALDRELAAQPTAEGRRNRMSASEASAVSGKSSSSPQATHTVS